jgi:hypothetical protein
MAIHFSVHHHYLGLSDFERDARTDPAAVAFWRDILRL